METCLNKSTAPGIPGEAAELIDPLSGRQVNTALSFRDALKRSASAPVPGNRHTRELNGIQLVNTAYAMVTRKDHRCQHFFK
jgi:hypothetical protein